MTHKLIDAARALAPEIAAERAAMDAARRLPDALALRFAEAGFYRLCIPGALGGVEADPLTLVGVIEALAEADASAGWCVMIGATTGALAAYVEEAAARAIFADPATILAGVDAPMGRATIEGDHYRVNGRWKWNSGGHNAVWLGGGCVIIENGAPRMLNERTPESRMMLFPAAAATLHDTWHTGGLRGTGSGDMEVRDLLVPRAHSVSLVTDRPRIETPLYRFPVFGLLAIGIAAAASGNARAALSEFAALAAGKRTPTGRTLAERASVQQAYAEAHAAYASARALLLQEIAAAWTEAQTGGAIAIAQRARLRLAATHMVRTGADVARRMQDLAGGDGVFLANSLQRRAADAQTMTAHVMTSPTTYELTGRALLGLPVNSAEL
jgi:alkylation response protein AidB-like acyl-CoA dehydrogenase